MEMRTDKIRQTQRLINSMAEYAEKYLAQKLYGDITFRLVCEAGKVTRIEKGMKETELIKA